MGITIYGHDATALTLGLVRALGTVRATWTELFVGGGRAEISRGTILRNLRAIGTVLNMEIREHGSIDRRQVYT